MEKNLEEIFWKDGKFYNVKGNDIKVEAIGRPFGILLYTPMREEDLKELSFIENKNIEFNAFSKSDALMKPKEEVEEMIKHQGYAIEWYAVQLYKI